MVHVKLKYVLSCLLNIHIHILHIEQQEEHRNFCILWENMYRIELCECKAVEGRQQAKQKLG